MKRFRFIGKKAVPLFLAVLLPASTIWHVLPVRAASDSYWIGTGTPSFEIEGEAINANEFTYGTHCTLEEVPYAHNETAVTGSFKDVCMQTTNWGSVSRSFYNSQPGYVSYELFRPKGATVAGTIKKRQTGSPTRILPVKDSNDIVTLVPCHTLLCIERHPNAALSWKRYVGEGVGEVRDAYDFDRSQGERLKNSDGTDTIIWRLALSSNGKWAIARVNGGNPGRERLVRINLETFEVMSIMDPQKVYSNGYNSHAISNDGRYGFYASTYDSYSAAKIVDFSTCDEPNPENNMEVVSGCQHKDIETDIKELSNDITRTYFLPEFNNDGSVLTLNLKVNGAEKRVAVLPEGQEYSGLDYLALGDSFASGEGDVDGYYEPGTNVPVSDELPKGEKCHISRRSYPYLVAQELGISSSRFRSVACSGAVMDDIRNTVNRGDDRYIGQFEQFKNIPEEALPAKKKEALEQFRPGRAAQIEFVEKYKPKIVTISIGGNDASFAEVIADCAITTIQCGFADPDNPDKRHEKAARVQQMISELKNLYEEIHHASERTKIYVLGYSKIIKKDGECSPAFGFNSNEREFIDQSFQYMNQIVEAAARQAGVEYLNVENALGEARLCGSNEPKAANGFTLGDDIAPIEGVRIVGAESYHPNHLGHSMVASQIASKINFDGCSPSSFRCPEEGIVAPEIPDYFKGTSHEMLQWRQPHSSIRLSEEDTYLIGQDGEIQRNYYYDPSSQTVLELHSEPRHLGTFQTDENGSLNASFTIPEDVPAGYHTLKLKGTLISGEEVEFTQTILVLGREGDRDNNGVPDKKQECIEAPIAVTDREGKVLVPPCTELDASFMEASPQPDDSQQHERPSLEESIAAARQAIRQFLEQSEYYRRLPFAEQQNLIALLERHAISRIANVMTYCDQNPESTVLNFNFLKIVLGCRKTEDGIQLSINMYFGLFKILFSSMTMKEKL